MKWSGRWSLILHLLLLFCGRRSDTRPRLRKSLITYVVTWVYVAKVFREAVQKLTPANAMD